MEELKPCPFCGGEATRYPSRTNGERIVCKGCGAVIWHQTSDLSAHYWNTRYERTCHVINPHRPNGAEGLGVFGTCSECGEEIETIDNHDRYQNPWKTPDYYCKNCGAKVVTNAK